VPLRPDDNSGNVISLSAYRAGLCLRHPRDAVLPWVLRLTARHLAVQLDLPYGNVVRTVCAGYGRRAS
jgi:hypothetical protein